jgi:hypothetical protein
VEVVRWIVIEYDEFRLFNHLELKFSCCIIEKVEEKIGKIAKDAFHTHNAYLYPHSMTKSNFLHKKKQFCFLHIC